MFIKLSDSLYMFGQGGINRIEVHNGYKTDGSKSDYITALYSNTTMIAVVKESVEEIGLILNIPNKSLSEKCHPYLPSSCCTTCNEHRSQCTCIPF